MTIAEKVEALFRERGLTYGGELLLPLLEALDYIKACSRAGLTILGIDFWTRSHGEPMELSGWSADFSSLASEPEATIRAAQQEIKRWLPDGRAHIQSVVSKAPDQGRSSPWLPESAEWASFVLRDEA